MKSLVQADRTFIDNEKGMTACFSSSLNFIDLKREQNNNKFLIFCSPFEINFLPFQPQFFLSNLLIECIDY